MSECIYKSEIFFFAFVVLIVWSKIVACERVCVTSRDSSFGEST